MALVALADAVGDGEAEAGALAVVGFIDLIEAVEHMGQIRRGDAHAGVADADADNVALRAGAQRRICDSSFN